MGGATHLRQVGGGGGGGGGAPTDAQYLLLVADPTLTDERIFTAGRSLTGVDGGAGNPYTLNADWLEFDAQAANPGVVAANTLHQDDGTNYDAGSLVWGDLSNPSVFGPNFSIGDPGLEQGGINVGGVNFDAIAKINDYGGAQDALLILHRHSSTDPASIAFARAASDDETHTALAPGDVIAQMWYHGWTGTHYDPFAVINAEVDPAGTVSATSSPGRIRFFTTPDGSNTAVEGIRLDMDQLVTVFSKLTLPSVTEGFKVNAGTTAERTALTDEAGLLFYDTDLNQLHQNDGAGWTIPGAGLTTLQSAYDNSLGAVPMILLDGVPTPMTFRASVAGAVLQIQDVGAANTIFEVDADPDTIVARAGVTIDNQYSNAAGAASIIMTDTVTLPAFVGGGIQSLGTVTYSNSTFIWALLQESKGYIANVGPGFAAFTLFNAIPFIRNGTNNALVQALVLNVGLAHQSIGANAVTTALTIGVSFSANTRALTAGGSMTKSTGDIGFSFGPTHGTVLGSTVNHGTLIGFRCLNPTVPLFQSGAGVETMTAYIGMDIAAIPFGGNVTKRGIRSALVAASNTRFIESTGTAESDHFGPLNLDGDFPQGLLRQGASQDYIQGWVGGTEQFFQQIVNPAVSQIRHSSPSADRWLIQHALGGGEFNISCDRFSLGDQTGANGNQVGNFVTPARTIGVAGEWADFLLTQAGSLEVDGNAMSRVSAWVINGVSYAASTGSVSNADTLTVGGFPTSSPGVTITERQSLHVIAGRSRFQSAMQFDPISPAALASGATDDWAGLLTGSANNGMRHWARVSGNAAGDSSITGIDAGSAQDGDTFKITNVSANTVKFGHENVGSSAANRIITPDGNAFLLTENNSLEIIYDATSSRWRILTPVPQAGGGGALSGTWKFDNTTTMADPGDGQFRLNNGTLASVTAVAIADETETGVDAGGILAALGNGDQLYIFNKEDSSEFIVLDITANTDNTGWHEFTVTVSASGNAFTDGKEFAVTAIFA